MKKAILIGTLLLSLGEGDYLVVGGPRDGTVILSLPEGSTWISPPWGALPEPRSNYSIMPKSMYDPAPGACLPCTSDTRR